MGFIIGKQVQDIKIRRFHVSWEEGLSGGEPDNPCMKKVLLGESEVLTPVTNIIKIKFVQNMDKP